MKKHSFFLGAVASLAALVCSSCSNMSSSSSANDEAEIRASLDKEIAAMNAKDLNAIMTYYSPDESLLVFDAVPPRQYAGPAAFRKDFENFLATFPTTIHNEVSDWKVESNGNLAYAHYIVRTTGPDKDGHPLDLTARLTDVYKKVNGKWVVVHEHVSFPVDLATGKADLTSKP